MACGRSPVTGGPIGMGRRVQQWVDRRLVMCAALALRLAAIGYNMGVSSEQRAQPVWNHLDGMALVVLVNGCGSAMVTSE